MTFMLHPQLAADCVVVGDLPICRVLLNAQFAQFPWLILVPMRTGCRDLTDLAPMDYPLVMDEVAFVHDKLKAYCNPTKMNVGALGNMVPQLHIHIIARKEGDEAWPKPVWGHAQPKPYAEKHLAAQVAALKTALEL
jgi:diadenosine tetraphosphate (Ap4A) HIT family hydrolase